MATKNNNVGEQINHLGLVRARVQGTGSLQLRAFGYSQNSSQELPSITLIATTDIIPTVLANFKKQKMQIQFMTTEINEHFRIRNIVPFTKPTAASYPM
jgi:hypothetical protein